MNIIINAWDIAELDVFPTGTKDEHVAVIIGSRDGDTYTVNRIVEVPNRIDDPTKGCKIMKSDVLAAGIDLTNLIGYLHTHPVGTSDPSYFDVVALPEGMIGMVYSPRARRLTIYNNTGFLEAVQR